MDHPKEGHPVNGAFISWLPFHERSQGLSDALGLKPLYVSYLGHRDLVSAPFKYGPQFIATLRHLARLRPSLVFVMDPPVFAVAAVFTYCRSHGARYVMDCHSGVFESSKWRWSMPLQRFFGRRAAAVMVTNPKHRDIVAAWPAPGLIIADPAPDVALSVPDSSALAATGPPFVFVVAFLSRDEAIPQILASASLVPDVQFRISGDVRRADPTWIEQAPPNVQFTGFLPRDQFWDQLRRASAILTLTTRDNTLLRGAWEAMFVSRPLITSDTPALRNYFHRGALFVDNTPSSLAAAVRSALTRETELTAEMDALRRERAQVWFRERDELGRVLGVSFRPRVSTAQPND